MATGKTAAIRALVVARPQPLWYCPPLDHHRCVIERLTPLFQLARYVGPHANVVPLIGVVTNGYNKPWVIVIPFCEHGSLDVVRAMSRSIRP